MHKISKISQLCEGTKISESERGRKIDTNIFLCSQRITQSIKCWNKIFLSWFYFFFTKLFKLIRINLWLVSTWKALWLILECSRIFFSTSEFYNFFILRDNFILTRRDVSFFFVYQFFIVAKIFQFVRLKQRIFIIFTRQSFAGKEGIGALLKQKLYIFR